MMCLITSLKCVNFFFVSPDGDNDSGVDESTQGNVSIKQKRILINHSQLDFL